MINRINYIGHLRLKKYQMANWKTFLSPTKFQFKSKIFVFVNFQIWINSAQLDFTKHVTYPGSIFMSTNSYLGSKLFGQQIVYHWRTPAKVHLLYVFIWQNLELNLLNPYGPMSTLWLLGLGVIRKGFKTKS